jgi:hypothetical protein
MNYKMTPTMSGLNVERIDATQRAHAKDALSALGENYSSFGLDAGDVMQALGKNMDTFSPFGVFLRVYGTIFNVVGAFFGTAISLFALALLARWLVSAAESIGDWWDKLKSYFSVLSGPVGLVGLFRDEERTRHQDSVIGSMTSAGFEALVMGSMPNVVAKGLEAAIASFESPGSQPTSALPALARSIASAAPAAAKAAAGVNPLKSILTSVGTNLAESALEKVWGMLGGSDSDAHFDTDDIRAIAQATGQTEEAVERQVLALAREAI